MKPLVLALAGVVLASVQPGAHHAISAHYDSSRQVRVEGVVAQFQFISPHPFVILEASGAGEAAGQWRLEMDNRGELVSVGMSADTLMPGDRVVVSGSPARDKTQRLYIRALDRPSDGFRYEQVGSRPQIRRGGR